MLYSSSSLVVNIVVYCCVNGCASSVPLMENKWFELEMEFMQDAGFSEECFTNLWSPLAPLTLELALNPYGVTPLA